MDPSITPILSSLVELIQSNSTKDVTLPPVVQFYMGSILSGAPFHSHGPAINALIYGKKEWTLLSPGRDIYSRISPLQWESDYYNGMLFEMNNSYLSFTLSSGCRVIQNAGELFYVPKHWTHQVINLAESVGFAIEIQSYN